MCVCVGRQEIVAILQEMIADLATREHMFTSMLAKAQAQVPLYIVYWDSYAVAKNDMRYPRARGFRH